MKIAYFGDENSHTYAAATALYPDADKSGFGTVYQTVAALRSGADAAVLPIENSGGGSVHESLDALFSCGAYITREIVLPIRHALIGLAGATLSGIETVYSHPQALKQCEQYLWEHLPNVTVCPSRSTSDALTRLSGHTDAAIARQPLSGQCVITDGIQDDHHNATRFVVVRRQIGRGGTLSLAMGLRHEPGSLLNALDVFRRAGVNLSKLESRPERDNAFRYWFYIEFDADGPVRKEVMRELETRTEYIKILGMYDRQTVKEKKDKWV